MLFKYVYNSSENEQNQPDSLVRYCSAFSHEMNIESLREILEDCEETYLRPYLSEAFLEEIRTAYDAYPVTSLSTEQEAIIRKLQGALAYFAAFEFMGNRGLQLSDTGPGEVVTQDGTYVFSRQWRTQSSMRKFYQTANRRMDRALSYLQSKADTFTTWKNSNAYNWRHDLFFNTAEELAEYLPMEADRVVFLMLRNHIKEAEQRYIYRTIGDALATELKTAMKAGTASSDQLLLIVKIRYALVYWARLSAIPNLRLRINESGIVEPDYDIDSGAKSQNKTSETTTRALWVSDTVAAQEFLSELKSWLWQNADKFPTYKDSTLYLEDCPPEGLMNDFNNSSKSVTSFL